ncbi:uncharacterized protein B0I36DRAFT_428199 [Microdochium trichocladiopsis]|uniref:holo-[acyl-carrier-protein] synthase n=1 Tax=Microdochium trichocladiopsis TaxID=1682393 RepID=A0A9P8YGK5_9PEZI|nr:uncharacterized protein B0I36DRAFT_428199 [Microdochium trichocladiopsis]KAH7037599.1 hypothetical protein B0I36DRAFT_428199 [Microdochium trichocladiopsis]
MATGSNIQILQYLVDTRELWTEATKTKDLEHVATRALDLLTGDERAKVLRFYFVADAKMALVSHLLKHWVVATTCSIPWSQTQLGRDERGKPIFLRSSPADNRGGEKQQQQQQQQPVFFNVSHQAGLVSLIVATNRPRSGNGEGEGDDFGDTQIDVGTDIVCTSERRDRDHKMIREKGWSEFVDMHADVFGRAETEHLKHGNLLLASAAYDDDDDDDYGASASANASAMTPGAIDAKLRAFYALWCYREAYVKMTGDALLASWLNDLEFKDFRAPERAAAGSTTQVGQPAGQIRRDCEILLAGEKVEDANVCLRSLGPDFMTCSAVRTPGDKELAMGIELGPYEWLSLEQILSDAEMAGGGGR